MIDYRIILQILHTHLMDSHGLIVKEQREWVSDDSMIIFPVSVPGYEQKVNALSAKQYLQRTRILYMTLKKFN
ncbi:MAG: hypothetical protein WKF87_03710 [Chryseolinea sp.]